MVHGDDWLTVEEAVQYGGWSNRTSVLSAIQRGQLKARNLNPDGSPHRNTYRIKRRWIDEYNAARGRKEVVRA